jgi:hypothetical protein
MSLATVETGLQTALILALGTRPMGPTDSQVYFAFCIFKAAVEIAFAFYTMWQWNVLFVVMQAESWGLDWLVVGSAKCCKGSKYSGSVSYFCMLVYWGNQPKGQEKRYHINWIRDRYADLPLQNLHVLSVADKTCRFQISSLVCWRGSPDFDIG